MDEPESLSHTKWECKYHVIFIPKRRRRTLYAELRKHLGDLFRRLASQKESRIEEGHLMPDHVHMLISILPKYAVSQVVGYIKGNSAMHLAMVYGERKRSFVGQHFWARGFFVSTVGRDETSIREYIRNQEQEDMRLDQMNNTRGRVSDPIAALSGSQPKAPGFAGEYLQRRKQLAMLVPNHSRFLGLKTVAPLGFQRKTRSSHPIGNARAEPDIKPKRDS
jgi:putative transposase